MRVTQSMLTNNNLKYISQNYNRLGSLMDQLNTGKKITRPSDDPVVAMKGMRYRSQVVEVDQFRRNLNEGFNWLENSDSALDETGQVLHRVRELVVQASNDSYNATSRQNIEKEISRLQEHLVAMANSRVGENYIFNGTDTDRAPINENQFNIDFGTFKNALGSTTNASEHAISYMGQTFKYDKDATENTTNPDGNYIFTSSSGGSISINSTSDEIKYTYQEELKYKDGEAVAVEQKIPSSGLVVSNINAVSTNSESVEIEVMKGVKIPINVSAQQAYSLELFSGLESIKKMLTNPETKATEITKALDTIDGFLDAVVSTRAELGAQVNRAEMVDSRLLEQRVVAVKTVSDNEDIDFEEAIMNLMIQESVHRASLAAGARIIQPTLMDFLR